MAFFYSIPAFDYSTRRPKKKKKRQTIQSAECGGRRGAAVNHGTTRGTTTGQPAGQPRDNHGTTTGQPRDNHGTTTGQPRDNRGHGSDTPRTHHGDTEPRRALATRANPRPRSFASPRFARTHERNETISRLGSQRTHPPNLRLIIIVIIIL